MKLFDNTLTQLERALDARLYRHTLLASDLANVDTPGHRARDLDFEAAMRSLAFEGAGADSRAAALKSATRELEGAPAGLDGNTVELDRTMAALADNGLEYGAAARAAGKKLSILRYVAGDGNG